MRVCVCVYIKYCILMHNLHTFSKPQYISHRLCIHVKDISKRILSQSLNRIGAGIKSRHGGEHTCISYGPVQGEIFFCVPHFTCSDLHIHFVLYQHLFICLFVCLLGSIIYCEYLRSIYFES